MRILFAAEALRGADAVRYFGIGSLVKDMRAGSPLLARIDAVGAANTAPPGQWPWWVRGDQPWSREPRTPLPNGGG